MRRRRRHWPAFRRIARVVPAATILSLLQWCRCIVGKVSLKMNGPAALVDLTGATVSMASWFEMQLPC